MSLDALFQLGMGSQASQTEEETYSPGPCIEDTDKPDYFITRNGISFAGSHLIIDLFEAERLDDLEHIRQAMVECVKKSGATLLHIHLHPFEPNGGVSGVAVLAESHISIHSWPERGYAALDVFMCGDAKPQNCIEVLRGAFRPKRIEVQELLRGKGA